MKRFFYFCVLCCLSLAFVLSDSAYAQQNIHDILSRNVFSSERFRHTQISEAYLEGIGLLENSYCSILNNSHQIAYYAAPSFFLFSGIEWHSPTFLCNGSSLFSPSLPVGLGYQWISGSGIYSLNLSAAMRGIFGFSMGMGF